MEKASALGLFAALFLTQVIATMAAARALTLPLPPAASALRLGGRRVEAAVSRASRRPLSVSASSASTR